LKYICINDDQSLGLSTTEIPVPKADECLIRVKAIGINRADILQRQGKYPAPRGESSILGLEVSGDIVKCGCEVDKQHWQVNDGVFGLVAGGAYAEYVAIKSSQLFKIPSGYSYQQAAATAEVFLTAFQALFTISNLQSKQKVLIHAGASGVGTAAIQLARAKNCFVVTTVSSKEKEQACLSLGADVAINYKTSDFVQWKTANLSQGFDVILDVVGGDYLNKNINVLALDGTIVTLSMLGGRFSDPIDIAKLLGKRVTLTASTLRNRSERYKASLVNSFKEEFWAEIEQGVVKPIIDSIYRWQDVEQAHQKMLNNSNIGKLVLSLEP